jgi:hypothetical protein
MGACLIISETPIWEAYVCLEGTRTQKVAQMILTRLCQGFLLRADCFCGSWQPLFKPRRLNSVATSFQCQKVERLSMHVTMSPSFYPTLTSLLGVCDKLPINI